ncbi:hypothetical protein FB451DRAFT_158189 [Mycena latifolia]|nr:hypothetical protein FB451DRAFT_158189 [Mycena latifolia]
MWRHQAVQLRALEQARTDAEIVAYQEQQRAQEAHFFHHQQQAQEQERRIEEERYHLQQMQHAAAPSAVAVPRPVRVPASPGTRDEHGGPDGAGHGYDGGLPSTSAPGAYGRLSLSPPAARSGLTGARATWGIRRRITTSRRVRRRASSRRTPGIAVLAGLPAPAAGLPPLRDDDALTEMIEGVRWIGAVGGCFSSSTTDASRTHGKM